MKKFLCLLLGLILTFGLFGCGDNDVDKNSFESAEEYLNNTKSEKDHPKQLVKYTISLIVTPHTAYEELVIHIRMLHIHLCNYAHYNIHFHKV